MGSQLTHMGACEAKAQPAPAGDQLNATSTRAARTLFTRLDTNNDGQLSYEELHAFNEELFYTKTTMTIQEFIRDLDQNADGYVNFDEWMQYWESIGQAQAIDLIASAKCALDLRNVRSTPIRRTTPPRNNRTHDPRTPPGRGYRCPDCGTEVTRLKTDGTPDKRFNCESDTCNTPVKSMGFEGYTCPDCGTQVTRLNTDGSVDTCRHSYPRHSFVYTCPDCGTATEVTRLKQDGTPDKIQM